MNAVTAQTNTIKVTYKAFPVGAPLEDNEIIKNSKNKYLYAGLDNALASLQFFLVANKVQCHFFMENGLAMNDRAKRLATAFTGKNNVYINLTTKLFVKQKNILNDIYFVSGDIDPKWKLIDEEKVIEGYLCFKAISEKVVKTKENTNKIVPVIAWYCPTIPFSFGPKEYFNLPGLIMELQEDKIAFLATKIMFNVEIKDLVLNHNTPIIKQEEYNIILGEKTDEFFAKIRKNKNEDYLIQRKWY